MYVAPLGRRPTSSAISRTTADSADSPGSTKPARVENAPAGQRVWRPSRALSLVVDQQGDDGRVGARVVLGAVVRAGPPPAQAGDLGRRPAPRAAGVRAVPVGQGEELGEDPALVLGQSQRRPRAGLPTATSAGTTGSSRATTRPHQAGPAGSTPRNDVGGAASIVGSDGSTPWPVRSRARVRAARRRVSGGRASPVGSSRISTRSPGTAAHPAVRRSARRSKGSWPRARWTGSIRGARGHGAHRSGPSSPSDLLVMCQAGPVRVATFNLLHGVPLARPSQRLTSKAGTAARGGRQRAVLGPGRRGRRRRPRGRRGDRAPRLVPGGQRPRGPGPRHRGAAGVRADRRDRAAGGRPQPGAHGRRRPGAPRRRGDRGQVLALRPQRPRHPGDRLARGPSWVPATDADDPPRDESEPETADRERARATASP